MCGSWGRDGPCTPRWPWLGTRDGDSVRGGTSAIWPTARSPTSPPLDAVIDRAVTAVGAARGIAVALPTSGGEAGGTVDVAALGEFTEQLTGRTGVLATAARTVLRQLGLDDAAVFDLDVDDEGGRARRPGLPPNWAPTGCAVARPSTTVAPCAARRPLGRCARRPGRTVADRHRRPGRGVHAADRRLSAVRGDGRAARHLVAGQGPGPWPAILHARVFAEIASLATDPAPGIYADDIAVVTGAADGSSPVLSRAGCCAAARPSSRRPRA